MTLYCMKCGHGTTYSSTKPRVCEGCKEPYVSVNITAITQISIKPASINQKRPKFRQPEPEIEENPGEEYYDIPETIDLKFQIASDLRPNRHEFSTMKGTGDGDRSPRKSLKSKKSSKKSKVTSGQAQKLIQEQFNNLNQQNRAENNEE